MNHSRILIPFLNFVSLASFFWIAPILTGPIFPAHFVPSVMWANYGALAIYFCGCMMVAQLITALARTFVLCKSKFMKKNSGDL